MINSVTCKSVFLLQNVRKHNKYFQGKEGNLVIKKETSCSQQPMNEIMSSLLSILVYNSLFLLLELVVFTIEFGAIFQSTSQ